MIYYVITDSGYPGISCHLNFLEIFIYNHAMHFNIILCILKMKIKSCIFAAMIEDGA